MRPILLTWRGFRVPSYTAMLYLGLLAGTYSAYATGRAEGLPGEALASVVLALLVPAILGARLAFVAGRWPVFRTEPGRILARGAEGGAVAYGALIAVPLSVPLLAVQGLPFASFWDAGAIGFLAAVVCLRIGCLLNGCCCGQTTSGRFGLVLRDAAGVRTRRIPTQLLEAGWAAVLLAGATFAVGQMPFAGGLFLLVLGAYAFGRFVLDFARDAGRRLGPLTFAQAVSAALVLLSLCVFAIAVLG